MAKKLSLRLRVFLFFCLLAMGAIALAASALFFGWFRSEDTLPIAPFLTAFLVFVFLNTGLAIGVWILFDEHMAKPIHKLSTILRLKAHSKVDNPVNPEMAPYLGDLAPAATALSETATSSILNTAAEVAKETECLKAQGNWLKHILNEIPIATILLNKTFEIVLYDAQAANILSQIAPPRLKASFADYFDLILLQEATNQNNKDYVVFKLMDINGIEYPAAKLKILQDGGFMIFIDLDANHRQMIDTRFVTFDFDLMNAAETKALEETDLSDICYVPFDTETTGLCVEKDAVIQLGAVRIINGRLIEDEVFNSFVNPDRPIPASSTKIHGISDLDVAKAPNIISVGRQFHHFARDSVFVAHNAPFDMGFLRKSEADMAVTWDQPILDTVLLSAIVFGTTEDHCLDALCERLSISIPSNQRHTALGDAEATGKAFLKLVEILKARGISTFGQVIKEARKQNRLLEDLNGK